MITRRNFFKKVGLLVGVAVVAPKVLLQQKETPKIVPYNHEFILDQRRYNLRKDILDGHGDWLAKKRDEQIFAAIRYARRYGR